MGAAWGVTPAIARVQAYLMARQEPLTEREVREALGPVAIAPPAWPSPRRSRGASSSASRSRGGSAGAGPAGRRLPRRRRPLAVVRAGHRRAQDPRGRPDRRRSSSRRPPRRPRPRPRTRTTRSSPPCATGSPRSSSSSGCSTARSGSCRSSSRASWSASLQLLGRVPDATILRLFDLLGGLDDGDVLDLVDALSRLSPTAARRATKLMSGVVRTVAR